MDKLNTQHQDQVVAYQKFFKGKTREQTNEIDAAFEDTMDMKLLEEMYSRDDVEGLLGQIRTDVKNTVTTEFEKYTNQTCLFLHQLYLQAEGHGANLSVDVSKLDESQLLSGIENLMEMKDAPESRKLESLGGTVDVKLVTRIKELEEQNERVQERFNKLQEQCKVALNENREMKQANADLTQQLRDAQKDIENLKSGNASAQQAEIDELRSKLADTKSSGDESVEALRAELKTVKDELAGKVADSSQFKQLKTMIQNKNKQLRELRDQVKGM